RRVSQSFRIEARPDIQGGEPIAELWLNGRLLFRVADPEGKSSPVQRAEQIRRSLDDVLMHRSAEIRDLRLGNDGTSIVAFGTPILRVLPLDARLGGKPAAQLAADALKLIQAELWKEKLDDLY